MGTVLLIVSGLGLAASLAALAVALTVLTRINRETDREKPVTEEQLRYAQHTIIEAAGQSVRSASAAQNQAIRGFGNLVGQLSKRTEDSLRTQTEKLEKINQTLNDRILEMQKSNEEKMEKMRASNEEKLEQMRRTVDEQLQESLSKRVSESFRLVQTQLENVQKGLGEMQTLASDVGGLKKTLENVKTKGIFGETQLSRILEDILTRDQYEENVCTRAGSRDPVEFAIVLPGKEDGKKVYLPIDSKFPNTIYANLIEAMDSGDKEAVDAAGKALEAATKKNAKDIRDKYIDPPNTTDFAIMFLPTEGLFAEVVRRTDLIETLRKDYKVSVAGPSTISAFLNSLQMGFRTLAIEKRSSEVWSVLGAVKTEFGKFEDQLKKVQKNFETAQGGLEKLVGERTRGMMRKLKSVEKLPEKDARTMLGMDDGDEDENENDIF